MQSKSPTHAGCIIHSDDYWHYFYDVVDVLSRELSYHEQRVLISYALCSFKKGMTEHWCEIAFPRPLIAWERAIVYSSSQLHHPVEQA